MSQHTFLVMAGGTGGHIFPGLAVAQTLREKGHQVVWLGSEGGMETTLVPKYDIPVETVAIKGIRGNGLVRKLLLPVTLTKSILAARQIIKKHKISAVVGFGGFAAFPGGVVARLCGLPVVIHEQNAIAGLVNKTLAKIATRVLFAFPGVFPDQDGLVGNPVRADITTLPPPEVRFAQRSGALKLFIVGGSLGARVFNEMLPEALALLKDEGVSFEVTHQSGKNSVEPLRQRYQDKAVVANCLEFIDDMPSVYAQADIVVCRAGALTIAELAASGLGSILVPFPFAVDDHQTANAAYLVDGGAAIILPQETLTAVKLSQQLKELTRARCLEMACKARALALPDAAEKVAQAVLATVEKNRDFNET